MPKYTVHFEGPLLNITDEEGKSTGPLSIGECLEQIIHMHYTKKSRYPMDTQEQWDRKYKNLPQFIDSDFEYFGPRGDDPEAPECGRTPGQAQDTDEPQPKV